MKTPRKNLKRQDGETAFSERTRAVADKRTTSKDGSIDRLLGPKSVFSPAFKKLVKDDHEGIRERFYLKTELEGARDVIRALSKPDVGQSATELLERLQAYPAGREEDCILCPIWRHEHQLSVATMLLQRYMFKEVDEEFYYITIVFDHADDLFKLEDDIKVAHKSLDRVISKMSDKRRGVVMVGAFEPDLRSADDYQRTFKLDQRKINLAEATRDQGWTVNDTGGWVLSGHFLVRVPHVEDLQNLLDDEFPSHGWVRAHVAPVKRDSQLAAIIMEMLAYPTKYPKPIFDVPTRGKKLERANRRLNKVKNVFLGPSMSGHYGYGPNFNVHDARRQWALFVDRMGISNMYFAVESVHAQKWQSRSEMHHYMRHGTPEEVHGYIRREIHRDTGPHSKYLIDPLKKKFITKRKTRPLQPDPDWVKKTDLDGYNPEKHVIPRYR